MIALRLELENYRNYTRQELDFGEGVNVIYGDNAQGKTIILEAVYFFAMGKSNRARTDAELIRYGEDKARICLEFSDRSRTNVIDAEIYRDKRKKIQINEIPIKRSSELVRRFNVVYFGPEYLSLVKDGPGVRRKNLDILISQIKPGYMAALGELKKIVESKNALLRMEHPNKTMLDIMDDRLSVTAANIILHRALYISRIESFARELQFDISNGTEELEMKYKCCIGDVSGLDSEGIRSAVRAKLEEARPREMRVCESTIGPHREDIGFFINGMEARLYSSQGQQKTIVMANKLAEVELIRAETNEMPVLLLDDIMSELDRTRRDYILGRINNMQILITCTDTEGMKVPEGAYRIEVENGHARAV